MIAEGGKKDMPRRGAFAVRIFLAAVSVTGLAFAAGVVVWSALSRPTDAYLMGEAARSFDLQASRSRRRSYRGRPPARGAWPSGHKPAPVRGRAARPARARRAEGARAPFMNLLAKPVSFDGADLLRSCECAPSRRSRARGRLHGSPLVRGPQQRDLHHTLGNGRPCAFSPVPRSGPCRRARVLPAPDARCWTARHPVPSPPEHMGPSPSRKPRDLWPSTRALQAIASAVDATPTRLPAESVCAGESAAL